MALSIIELFPENFPILQTVLSGFVAFVLGLMWYNPKVMGEKMISDGVERITTNTPPILFFVGLLLWMCTAFVYSFLTTFLTPPKIHALLGLSTFLWVGFVLPPVLINGMMAGKKLVVSAVDSSYFLAGLYLFAVIHDVL